MDDNFELTSTTPFLYTESAGNVSQTSFGPDSVPRTWKSRTSRARAVDAQYNYIANVTHTIFEIVQKKSRSGEYKNHLIISVIKNVERASTARARESRDFHVRSTESGPNDV